MLLLTSPARVSLSIESAVIPFRMPSTPLRIITMPANVSQTSPLGRAMSLSFSRGF